MRRRWQKQGRKTKLAVPVIYIFKYKYFATGSRNPAKPCILTRLLQMPVSKHFKIRLNIKEHCVIIMSVLR